MSNQEMDNLPMEEDFLEEHELESEQETGVSHTASETASEKSGEKSDSDTASPDENNSAQNGGSVKKDRKTLVRDLLELGRSKGKLTTQGRAGGVSRRFS